MIFTRKFLVNIAYIDIGYIAPGGAGGGPPQRHLLEIFLGNIGYTGIAYIDIGCKRRWAPALFWGGGEKLWGVRAVQMCLSVSSQGTRAYNASGAAGESRTGWLGPLEHAVLSRVLELGLSVFRPSQLGLGVDRRRAWDALQRLVRRGILRRVSRGVYRVVADLPRLLSLRVRRLPGKDRAGEGDGTRGRGAGGVGVGSAGSAGVCGVEGPFLDNVRGVSVSGRVVRGDRGRVRRLSELVFFEGVSYAEVLWRVRGAWFPGHLVLYSNALQDGEAVRVEWRPPRGYVKRNGLGSALRMYWEVVLVAWRCLAELLLRASPPDVRLRALRVARARLGWALR